MKANEIISFEKRANGEFKDVVYNMDTPAGNAKYLARHPYAWPGGYPMFSITDDGGALCAACNRSEFRAIAGSYPNDGWHVTAVTINYEDTALYCDHCGNRIESAYNEV